MTKVLIMMNPRHLTKPCRAGDIKISKQGVYSRQHRMHDGCTMVKNGRYQWEWVRTGDAPKNFTGRPVITRISEPPKEYIMADVTKVKCIKALNYTDPYNKATQNLEENPYRVELLSKTYAGESICDMEQDVGESLLDDYNPMVEKLPKDEHGFTKGSFKVVITWGPDEQ